MNVVFLDIDGPVISAGCFYSKTTHNYMNPLCLTMLNALCDRCDAQVVISSTKRNEGAHLIENMMQYGFDRRHLARDWRIDLPIGNRYELIARYVAKHPEIDKYVLLDDEDVNAHRPHKHLPKHPIVFADPLSGATYVEFAKLEYALGKPELLDTIINHHLYRCGELSEQAAEAVVDVDPHRRYHDKVFAMTLKQWVEQYDER